ncbi:alpha-glucosidase C-terminal domain-containing protein, partial [Streptomyces sp. NRRL WC-3626]|uniref:alpha-glucosidase C-terminal domain-containing protein n=1 Tax=Streptomyces sp. NRRL WC-3626 TaxID=1463926 RepID=UPI0004BE7469
IFLRNHDELTLEMVTDEERDYMWAEYAKDPRMRANIGIRRRLAPLLDNDRNQIELFNALLLSLPGSPIIYYGDEIGMGDNIWLGDRDAVRTPMQWTPDSYTELPSSNPAVLAFLREYGDDLVLCVNNFSRFSQPTELDLRAFDGRHPVELFGGVRFPAIGELPYLLTLGGHGFYWFRLTRVASRDGRRL